MVIIRGYHPWVPLDPAANTAISADYRLCKAEAHYWKHAAVFRGLGSDKATRVDKWPSNFGRFWLMYMAYE